MIDSTIKNIALLFLALVFMVLSWSIVQFLRAKDAINYAESPYAAIKQANEDAVRDFYWRSSYFDEQQRCPYYEVHCIPTTGVKIEAPSREYYFDRCRSQTWHRPHDFWMGIQIHACEYVDYDIYKEAYNGKMAELSRARESSNK